MVILKQPLVLDSLLEIITESENQNFNKPTDIYSVTNAIGEIEASVVFLAVTFSVGR